MKEFAPHNLDQRQFAPFDSSGGTTTAPENKPSSSLAVSTRPVGVTPNYLLNQGFVQGEVEKLSALREDYPFIEYADSNAQWRRLMFLKWRYQHGDLQRR